MPDDASACPAEQKGENICRKGVHDAFRQTGHYD